METLQRSRILSLCPCFHRQVKVAGSQEHQVDHVVSALPADGELYIP